MFNISFSKNTAWVKALGLTSLLVFLYATRKVVSRITRNMSFSDLSLADVLPPEGKNETVAQLIARRALSENSRPFLIDPPRTITYDAYFCLSYCLGKALRQRCGPRKRHIAVIMDNSIEYALLYGACALWDLVICPVNKSLSQEGKDEIIRNVEATVIITDGEEVWDRDVIRMWELKAMCREADSGRCLDPYEGAVERWSVWNECGDKPWMILSTSGTSTGKPKGCVRSQNSSTGGYEVHCSRLGFSQNTLALISWPFHSISSAYFLHNYMYARATVVIQKGFRPEDFVTTFSKHQITFATSSIQIAMSVDEFPSSLRTILISGTEIDKQALWRKFPKVNFYDAYGSTEGGLICLSDRRLDLYPIVPDGALLKKLPSGETELWAQSPMMFSSYYNNPKLTNTSFEDGYFKTGDLARLEGKKIRICGRKDDMMITPTGHCIYPAEIEQVLGPCVVFGHPSNTNARILICAFEEGTEEELRERSTRFLGAARRPRVFSRVDAFPRTANGKIQRSLVRSQVSWQKN